jgi:signal transduction histidine kinase
MKPFHLTFQSRTILIFSAITVALVATMSRLSYVTARQVYLDQLSDHVRLMTTMIVRQMDQRQLAFLNPSGGPSLAGPYFQTFLAQHKTITGAHGVALFNRELTTIASSENETLDGNIDPVLSLHRKDIESLSDGETMTSVPFRGADGQWYMWCFYRIDDRHYLSFQESAARFEELEALARLFWTLGLIGIAMTVAGGFFLARTISRPVQQLVAFSRELGQGLWQARLPETVKGELDILVRAMDTMRNRLIARHEEKETLLAQIAHEIRNPLGSLELLAGLVREDLQNHRLDSRYAETMLLEIAGLKTLISDYLNYGRPARPNIQIVDVGKIVEEVQRLNAAVLSEKKIDFQTSLEPVAIRFDPAHLRQVIHNLVANAATAVPVNGRISIRAYRNNGAAVIDVSDNGPGIPDSERNKIFEPFFTTRSGGTGLGLAICKKLCLENNALIDVGHASGGGTLFTIRQ